MHQLVRILVGGGTARLMNINGGQIWGIAVVGSLCRPERGSELWLSRSAQTAKQISKDLCVPLDVEYVWINECKSKPFFSFLSFFLFVYFEVLVIFCCEACYKEPVNVSPMLSFFILGAEPLVVIGAWVEGGQVWCIDSVEGDVNLWPQSFDCS